jgi:tripartite-type tricarboxylate transporter receptor subunit TctC
VHRIRGKLIVLITAAFGASLGVAAAQDYPTKPITLIVPFTPGGSTSVIARAISDKLSEQLKQPIVIDNRGGAGSTIGARAVAKSSPDGSTILLGTNATLTIALQLTRNAGYERKDLASIGFVGAVPNVVAVNPKSPVHTIAELIKHARSSNEAIQFGSPGIGTVNHLSGELLAHTAKIKLAHVPYRGAMPALSDLLGGHISLLFSAIPNVHSHIGAGTVRALAVTGQTLCSFRTYRRSRNRPPGFARRSAATFGARRYAAPDHRPAQPRASSRADNPGRAQAPRQRRCRATRHHAGGIHGDDRS